MQYLIEAKIRQFEQHESSKSRWSVTGRWGRTREPRWAVETHLSSPLLSLFPLQRQRGHGHGPGHNPLRFLFLLPVVAMPQTLPKAGGARGRGDSRAAQMSGGTERGRGEGRRCRGGTPRARPGAPGRALAAGPERLRGVSRAAPLRPGTARPGGAAAADGAGPGRSRAAAAAPWGWRRRKWTPASSWTTTTTSRGAAAPRCRRRRSARRTSWTAIPTGWTPTCRCGPGRAGAGIGAGAGSGSRVVGEGGPRRAARAPAPRDGRAASRSSWGSRMWSRSPSSPTPSTRSGSAATLCLSSASTWSTRSWLWSSPYRWPWLWGSSSPRSAACTSGKLSCVRRCPGSWQLRWTRVPQRSLLPHQPSPTLHR